MSEVKLIVNNQEFSGWKEISITRSLTAVSGKFELSVTDSWDIANTNWTLPPGASCVVTIDGETIVTGFIDSLETSIDGNTRSITVSGRDKTCDLVDCSMPSSPGSNANLDLFKYAQILCQPFGITVVKQADVGAVLSEHRVQAGETIYSVLEKWSRRRGVLFTTNGLGQLVIVKVGGDISSVGLVQGENVKKFTLNVDQTQRFRNYLMKTQSVGFDGVDPGWTTGVDAACADRGISRNRTLLMLAEESMTPDQLKTRVQWEAAFRAADGMRVTADVVGWRQKEGGALWAPNQRVNIDAQAIGIRREMLIGEVTYVQSESEGTVTKLKLARKDAYQPKPEVDPELDWLNGSDTAE